ncbi:MAG: cbb3-type cytochrome oxidase assembly protein CcoS [Steroidobacteraceae bacterium]
MSVVFILIPLSLVLVGLAAWAFFWAVNSGQFDDLETPGWEILTDSNSPPTTTSSVAEADVDPTSAEES